MLTLGKCTDVAAGVSYLHSIGMVHGDLKAVSVRAMYQCLSKLIGHALISMYRVMYWYPRTGSPKSVISIIQSFLILRSYSRQLRTLVEVP